MADGRRSCCCLSKLEVLEDPVGRNVDAGDESEGLTGALVGRTWAPPLPPPLLPLPVSDRRWLKLAVFEGEVDCFCAAAAAVPVAVPVLEDVLVGAST